MNNLKKQSYISKNPTHICGDNCTHHASPNSILLETQKSLKALCDKALPMGLVNYGVKCGQIGDTPQKSPQNGGQKSPQNGGQKSPQNGGQKFKFASQKDKIKQKFRKDKSKRSLDRVVKAVSEVIWGDDAELVQSIRNKHPLATKNELKTLVDNVKRHKRNSITQYFLLDTIQYLLRNETDTIIKNGLKVKNKRFAVCHCRRTVKKFQGQANQGQDNFVTVEYNKATQKASYGNLQTCDSPWLCPHCGKAIAEYRRKEIFTLVERHLNYYDHKLQSIPRPKIRYLGVGGLSRQVVMVTLTVPHYLTDSLDDVLGKSSSKVAENKGIKGAKSLVYKGGKRSIIQELKDLGLIGEVASVETPYGLNGWHPHYHLLMFIDDIPDAFFKLKELHLKNIKKLAKIGLSSSLDLNFNDHKAHHQAQKLLHAVIKDGLYCEWVQACNKAGLPKPSYEHGVHVQDGSQASKYVSKFEKDFDFDSYSFVDDKELQEKLDNKELSVDEFKSLLEQGKIQITQSRADYEMSYGISKQGRKESLSYFDLVVLAVASDTEKERQKYANLVKEYAYSTFRLARIKFSKGLRERYDLADIQEKDLMEQIELERRLENQENIVLVKKIDLTTWRLILDDSFGRVKVLGYIELDCLDGGSRFNNYVQAIRGKHAQNKGEIDYIPPVIP